MLFRSQAVSSAAVAAAPQTAAAPQIMKSDMDTSGMNSGSGMSGGSGMGSGSGMSGGNPYIMGTSLPQNLQEWLEALFPFNPLSPQGWSMHPSLSMFLSRVETLIPMYAHNPAQLLETIVMLGLQFVIHRTLYLVWLILYNPGALLSFFLSNPVYTLGLAAPLLLVPAGAAGGLAGLAGLAGAAPVPAAAPSLPMPPATIPVAAAPPVPAVHVAPTMSPAPVHSPAPVPATASAIASAPSGPPPSPPTVVGPQSAMAAQNFVSSYLVGVLGARSETGVDRKAQRSAPDPAAAAASSAASRAAQGRARRRRRTAPRRIDRGYRYEFLDLESETPPNGDTSMASGQPVEPAGVADAGSRRPAGLTRLSGNGFGGGPTAPMMPGTWHA